MKELYLKVLTGGELGKAETPMTKVSLDVTSIRTNSADMQLYKETERDTKGRKPFEIRSKRGKLR